MPVLVYQLVSCVISVLRKHYLQCCRIQGFSFLSTLRNELKVNSIKRGPEAVVYDKFKLLIKPRTLFFIITFM